MAARALLSLALGLLACTPGFQSPSQVQDLRVLAVAAEPPEAFADLDAGTVDPVTVTVLVADPAPRAPVAVSASICFPTDSLICDGQKLDLPTEGRLTPGEVAFTLQPPAALVVGALQNDKLKGLGGVRVQFTASATDGDPAGAAQAEKVLLFSTVPKEQANHSPHISFLEISRAGGAKERLQAGETLHLAAGEEVGIRPLVGLGPDGAETYTTTDLAGREVTLTEQLQYTVFTMLGCEWDKDSAYEPLPGAATPPFGIVRLHAYVGPGVAGTFWVVVRDGRGGLSWFIASWATS